MGAWLFLGSLIPAQAFQFRVIGWDSDDTSLEYKTGRTVVNVSVSTSAFSPTYDFKGEGPIIFYKKVETEGKTLDQTACTAAIPPGLKQGLLLLLPGDDSSAISRQVVLGNSGFAVSNAPLIYNYFWLDDSLEAHPSGTILFRNFSSRPIALQIANRQLTLAPKEMAQVPLAKARRMAFQAAAQINGQWKVFATNALSTDGPDRMLIILRDTPPAPGQTLDPNRPNLSIISLFDWLQPVVATGAPDVAN